ncbi:MAG: hypothetical protein ACK5Y2_03230 [Bdellovibrionales bacterium]
MGANFSEALLYEPAKMFASYRELFLSEEYAMGKSSKGTPTAISATGTIYPAQIKRDLVKTP